MIFSCKKPLNAVVAVLLSVVPVRENCNDGIAEKIVKNSPQPSDNFV